MSKKLSQMSTAENLARLAKDFKSGDPQMSANIRREFKDLSKNDTTRVCVYLMEVIGSRDAQFQTLQKENADLKELLKLNDIKLDGENDAAVGSESAGINLQTGEASQNA